MMRRFFTGLTRIVKSLRAPSLAAGFFLLVAPELAAKVVIHPVPAGLPENRDYTVRVAGQPCFVHAVRTDPKADDKNNATFEISGMINFDFDQPVTIEVEVAADRPFESAKIRPLAQRIVPQIAGRKIRFTLPRPMCVVLEIDGRIESPLHVFGNPLETGVPDPRDSSRVIEIKPGQYDDAEIDRLIRGQKGKTIYLGPGIYEGRQKQPLFFLREGQTVYLAGGAYVKARFRTKEDNVTLRGRGIVDKTSDLRYSGHSFTLLAEDMSNLTVEGLTFLDGHGWVIQPRRCRNVVVRGVKEISYRNGSDACNPTSCDGFVIEDCFFRTGDDCIAIKSQGGVDCRNVRVRRCVLWSDIGWGACEIGHDTGSSFIRDVRFEDIDVLHVRGSAIGIQVEGSATVTDVIFRDIRVESPRMFRHNPKTAPRPGHVIHFAVQQDTRNRNSPPPTGRVEGILVENLSLVDLDPDEQILNQIVGHSRASPVTQIRIKNFTWLGKPVRSFQDAPFATNEFTGSVIFEP